MLHVVILRIPLLGSRWVRVWMKTSWRFLGILTVLGLLPIACVPGAPAVPTPDIPATVEAAVRAALPTQTPAPTPNLKATIEAGIQAALEALPPLGPTAFPTTVPTATPNIESTGISC